jgi:phage terminase small subunit
MGKRGPIAKAEPAGHRTNVRVLPGGDLAAKPPRAPSGLLELTRKEWRTFWASPQAAYVNETNLPAVRRLFVYRDKWARAMALVEGAMLVKGSMGQIRTNPMFDTAIKLEGVISRLEDSLGITPMAAARLGMTASQTMTNLAALNASFEDDPGEEAHRDAVDVDADPRFTGTEVQQPGRNS